uniref:Uncharacterized protein n=1 Tax=Arcella intermedia TaxID=1963864 RepID=A0A6B2LWR5_9EUKA
MRGVSMFALFLIKILTISNCPLRDATVSGVQESSLR